MQIEKDDKVYTPREVFHEVFPSLGVLPIKGGWGLSREEAVIIDKNDESVNQHQPFNGVAIEYTYIEYFNYLDLVTFKSEDERYSGIRYEKKKQELIQDEQKIYDKLSVIVTCFTDNDWDELKQEYENNAHLPDFDEEAHNKKRDEKQLFLEREFWFEISSFY